MYNLGIGKHSKDTEGEEVMENYEQKTKKELVELINMLQGPEVTTRPRKDTLIEILKERVEEAGMPKDYICDGDARNITFAPGKFDWEKRVTTIEGDKIITGTLREGRITQDEHKS